MYLNFRFTPELTEEIKDYVKKQMPSIINEEIFQDENKLRSMIRDSVRGQLKSLISELLQGRDFREYLRDKIWEQIKTEE